MPEPKSEQTLYKQPKDQIAPNTKQYVIVDEAGIYISFHSAQEAVDWIAQHTPNAITHMVIDDKVPSQP